ncbi:peptidoglycan bridge formation glycyltransferase FemA/FemB family protein [Schaalia sp. ZJ405]|uniref:peptidoglycan bridge formation glycyltransferase FemA/FemB family protein n=1 Tax=Schaalia sp. ZJ405 TaxID=2709403 RepID=UPI0013ED161E|nr:peptidoglycan bridge formation glycyltransferase FemA/FemB family protein [Schaalia sp. ZJ405]QPK80721.1 peptidoglycan bridge formation glycyltransferase FemA/FemB family protein [Schaalia sp. ZJ405]
MRHLSMKEIAPSVFDAFSATHPLGNFQQTTRMATTRIERGDEVEYLGVFSEDTLVGATLLEIHPSRFAPTAEIHDGPLIDFGDDELVSFFFTTLRERLRSRRVDRLVMTPELPYRLLDENGTPPPINPHDSSQWPRFLPRHAAVGPLDHEFNLLLKQGFTHRGFDTGLELMARWRFLKDLSDIHTEADLLATYSRFTKRKVRIAASSGLVIERVGSDKLPVFHELCELSAEKQGFKNRELHLYELLSDAFDDQIDVVIAYVDTAALLDSWTSKREEFIRTISRKERRASTAQNPEKAIRELDDLRRKLSSAQKHLDDTRRAIEKDGTYIPVACGLFIWHERECAYLYSGSNRAYASLCAPTLIQHHMMLECIKRGITRYNFYGIHGVFDDPHHPGRGLLEFKQGFGGYVEELMGIFTLPLRPGMLAFKKALRTLLRR